MAIINQIKSTGHYIGDKMPPYNKVLCLCRLDKEQSCDHMRAALVYKLEELRARAPELIHS